MNRATAQRDDWNTPLWLFNLLHRLYHFTIDAAASDKSHLLTKYWTEREDGLSQSWKGERVFCNPPFSQKAAWAKKAAEREADVAVLLLPATVDQKWFHRYVLGNGAEVIVPEGRIKFEPPPGVNASSPRFATIVAVYSYFRVPGIWRSGGHAFKPNGIECPCEERDKARWCPACIEHGTHALMCSSMVHAVVASPA